MRALSSDFAAHLAGDVTTLATCWRLTRSDGKVFGFTDHDQDLTFGGTTYLAASGFSKSEGEAINDLSAPTGDVAGAFSADVITEADLVAGRFDGAEIEVYAVNWQAPDMHHLLKTQNLGEVKRQSGQFSAELRSRAAKLQLTKGRILSRRCDAAFGDSRCGLDMTANGRRVAATVLSMPAKDQILVQGVETYAENAFRYGRLTVNSGTDSGLVADIELSKATEAATLLTLWMPMAVMLDANVSLSLDIGCDKAFATCRDTFANAVNFRGFPHMPGQDFAYSYVSGTTTHDGSVLFK